MVNEHNPGDGGLSGAGYHSAVRVYYENTDVLGMVYHADYLAFAERARSELLRALGMPPSQIWDQFGLAFVVRRCVVDFRGPAHLDDQLIVVTSPLALGGASLDLLQRILRNGVDLVRLEVKLAAIARNGRPMRIPAEVKAILSRFCAGDVWVENGH